jgi:hypothetical protein
VFDDTPEQVTLRRRRDAYGLPVGTTGLIFGAIAIAWLAYLVPHFARHRGEEIVDADDPASRFSDSVRILKHGTAPLLDQDLAEISTFEVSTPVTRRAAVADLRRLEALAAQRRRRVLIALLVALTAALGVHAAGWLPWWAPVVPGALLLVFVVVARVSVRAMRRSLDARYEQIGAGSQEATVFLSRRDVGQSGAKPAGAAAEAKPVGALWDPVPITVPTYVSKPLAPRTVRTIDLSGPEVSATARTSLPVIADPPVSRPVQRDQRGDDLPEVASA